MPTYAQIIVWIIVGLLAGSLTSRLITWDSAGFGRWVKPDPRTARRLIGGVLFRLFGWFPNLDLISVSLRDIVAAVIGSLIVLGAWWFYQCSQVS